MTPLLLSDDPFRPDNFVEEMMLFWESVGTPIGRTNDSRKAIPRWLDDLHDWLVPDALVDAGLPIGWIKEANTLLRPQFVVICRHLEQFETLVRLGAPEEAFRALLESLC